MAGVKSVCGRISPEDLADPELRVSDLPFELGDHAIVIVEDLPVIECPHCGAYAA
jgi:YgiT-type zinc finger domain-containing protein